MFTSISMAFQALAANKLRSVLTMLGTIIGVACVVTLWNLGESSRRYMRDALKSIGQDILFISPKYGGDEEDQRRNRYRPLSLRDVAAVQQYCPSIKGVSPVLFGRARAIYGARFRNAQIRGCYPSYLSIRNWVVDKGVSFSNADLASANRVVLLGSEVTKELFGSFDPLGRIIRLDKVPFTVIGVLRSKGSYFGENQDDRILAPYSSVADHMGYGRNVHVAFAAAKARDLIPQAKREINLAIREVRNLPPDRKDPIDVRDLGEIARSVDRVLIGATMFLGAVAAISLLVGGIGIMNIMLVSVTERTKEIGLRMALGATDFNVLSQFLIEAIVLSGIGGLFGTLLGMGGAALGITVLTSATQQPWVLSINPVSVVVALCFSAGVGVFFGFYPAWRASRLDPIEALRRE